MHERVIRLVNLQAQSITPPWVFFTFFKFHKLYQIAQNILYVCYQGGGLFYHQLMDKVILL